MKMNKTDWSPNKFEQWRGRWRSSRKEVGIGSRLNADCIAAAYEELLTDYARGDLIDLGCGNAPLTGMYKNRVASYIWADWPSSPHRLYELDLEVDLNERLPFPSNSFDTILLSDVLEHMALPDSLFVELTRILKIGGHIILGVPFLYCLHEEPHDYHRYTRHKLRDFADRNGLVTIELREYAGGLDTIQDALSKICSLSPVTKLLAYLIHYTFNLVKSVPAMKRLNGKIVATFPLGYVAVYRKDPD